MRTRTWLVGMAGTAVLVAGALTGSALIAGSPTAAPAAAAPSALTAFGSCEALRTWYVDSALRQVGPYGWEGEGGPVPIDAFAAAGPQSSDARAAGGQGALESQTSSETGTNVQERGVDEPDLAKSDGRRLVRVVGGRIEVYDVTGPAPRRTGSFALPDQSGQDDAGWAPGSWELLLVGDSVVALRDALPGGAVTEDLARSSFRAPGPAETRVLVLRLNDGDPVEASDRTWSGQLLATRQHGDVVRLVLRQGLPEIAFPLPAGASTGQPRPAELLTATRRNQALVRATRLEDWVPTVRDSGRPITDARPAVACDDVLHPTRDAGPGTLTVVGFDPVTSPDQARDSTTAITASGDQVYAGEDSLYVATTRYHPQPMATGAPIARSLTVGPPRTEVHRFDLTGTTASYVASGTVQGTVRDRWSMDTHAGRLRLAVERTDPKGVSSSSVVLLAQDDERLVETGRVDGLGRGEQIKSVRWFDDLAVVVTFRQTDPLYVLDLSDAGRPRLRGQLKVPGFSGYLHPIGDDRLLGLGSDADPRTGAARGGLAQVFDLTDPDRPRQTSRAVLGDLDLTAPYEPRTLTWTAAGVGYTTAYVQREVASPTTALLTVRVADGRMTTTRTRLAGVDDPVSVRTLALADGRVALVTPAAVSFLG